MDNQNDNRYNNQNNSLYDNLNIYEEQDNIDIKFIYDISYLTYKKKIFTSIINENFKLIISLFDENICDILINICILKKKNKITEKEFIMFKVIFDYVEKINNIVYIDSENFFLLLMDFYKLKNLSVIIDIFFENYIFKDLINYKMLTNKIILIYNKLSEKILLLRIYDELNKTNNFNIIKNKIIYLAKKISFDLFMFYNSQNIFEIILDNFLYIENFHINGEFKNNSFQIINENKNLLNIFETHKIHFMKEYDKSTKKYFDIYSNDIELYIKFKINNTNIINKFIENITYIKNIQ